MARRCCQWWRRSEPAPLCEELTGTELREGGRNRAAVEELFRICRLFDTSGLPPAASQLLAEVQSCASRLEGLVLGKAWMALALPWPAPEEEEHVEFEALCPAGGHLLRTQVCVATEGSSEDWVVGRMFVSDRGIVFDGAGMAGVDRPFQTGLLRWRDVVRWTESCDAGSDAEVMNEVTLTMRAPSRVGSLRLQLGFDMDSKCLHEVWRQCRKCEAEDMVIGHMSSVGHMSTGGPESFCGVGSEEITGGGAWHDREPTCRARVARATLQQVRALLQAESHGPLFTFMREVLKVYDMTYTPWTKGRRSPDTVVRKVQFKTPTPEDVPRAIAKMVGLPKFFDVTLIARIHASEGELSLVMQSCSLNAPYGDCFRVQDVIVFSPDRDGVAVTKWTYIVWVKSVPWTVSAAKAFLESRMQMEAVEKFVAFERILNESVRR